VWTAEAWSVPTLTIRVEGETVYEAKKLPVDEAKKLVIEKAREAGLSKFIVKINGETVAPAEFDDKYVSYDDVIIEIFKADYAG